MWSDAGSVVSWIVSVGAVVAAGFAVMFFGTAQVLKQTVDALERRAVVREQLLTDETAAKVKAQAEAEVLRNVVTGEAHLVVIEGKADEIASGLESHHAEAMAGVDRITNLLSRLVEQGDG
jgi:hypothetical protein